MTDLILVDDAVAQEFAPFSLTRPASELRAGAKNDFTLLASEDAALDERIAERC